jgi:hypothetical protein
MTKDEALKLALEALEVWVEGFSDLVDDLDEQAITAIKEALTSTQCEKQPAQAPVATSAADHIAGEIGYCQFHAAVPNGSKLYAAQQQEQQSCDRRPWIGLTEADYSEMSAEWCDGASWAEDKLKGKNFD